MNQEETPLPAFAAYGIELEFMIVDREQLSILPIADRLLHMEAGEQVSEVQRGQLAWSNELVLHVIEVKNPSPTPALRELPEAFQREVRHMNQLLKGEKACLMPAAMHPWMNPRTDTYLWPHANEAIYRAYARIFDSRSHGWSNLQSMHINLPFRGDQEFARLHAAIRMLLPILPALAASSPIVDGRWTGHADYRMHVYCRNAEEVPSIAGLIIPEAVRTRQEYQTRILSPMYRDIAAYDPERVLQHEWLNSRGAIPRFDRDAIEIRVIDTQECVEANLAIATAAIFAVRRLYDDGDVTEQLSMPAPALAAILHNCISTAERAAIDDGNYLALLGFPGVSCTAGELWQHLIDRMPDSEDWTAPGWKAPLQVILRHGPLARRILKAVGPDLSRPQLTRVYRRLCECLQEGSMFVEDGA